MLKLEVSTIEKGEDLRSKYRAVFIEILDQVSFIHGLLGPSTVTMALVLEKAIIQLEDAR